MSNRWWGTNKKFHIYFLAIGVLLVIITVGEFFGNIMMTLSDSNDAAAISVFSKENVIFLVHASAGLLSIIYYYLLLKESRSALMLWQKAGIFLFTVYLILFFLIDPALESGGFAPN